MNEATAVAPKQDNPFGSRAVVERQNSAVAEAETQRAIAETQAALIIAKRFPRNQIDATDRILQAFTRPTLAETALYSYSRGGQEITGPSIRAAETIAQNWGNIDFGIKELSQANGASEVMAYAWDTETNTRQVKVFQVPHKRFTKKGSYALEDPRDIYEMVANQGARRLRACILGVIPGDVIEAATDQAEKTLHSNVEVTPDLIKMLIEKFGEYGVSKEMIEKRIQRRIESIPPASVVQLRKIYNSMKDGMSSPAEWFDMANAATTGEAGKTATTGAGALKAAAMKKPSAAAKVEGGTDNETGETESLLDKVRRICALAINIEDSELAFLKLDDAKFELNEMLPENRALAVVEIDAAEARIKARK